jgi:hypothetical protein
MLTMFLAAAPAVAQTTVRVVAAEATVSLQPDPASPVVLKVAAGTVLQVEDRGDEWYAVLLPADLRGLRRYGYIPVSVVEPFEPRANPQAAASPAPSPFPPATVTTLSEPPPAQPHDRRDWARERTFIGLSFPFHRFRGSREQVLGNGSDLLVVPTLRSSYGVGVTIGHRFPASAIELSYVRSAHRSTAAFDVGRPGRPSILLFEDEAVYHRVNLDFKRYLARRWRAQPYLQAGFGFPWLKVRQGGLVQATVVDATYSGIGADGGAGVLFFLHPRFAVHGGAVYRYDLYLSARGGGGDWSEIRDVISVHGVDVVTGLSFVF